MRGWLALVRTLLAALVLLGLGVAHAAARLTIDVGAEQVKVYVDGMPLNASMGAGAMKTMVTPGVHIVQVQDPEGQVLYSGQLDVPGGADVKTLWTPETGLRITAPVDMAEPVVLEGPEPELIEQNAGPEADPAIDDLQDDRKVSQHAPAESQYAGGGENLGTVGRVAGDVVTATTGLPTSPSDVGGVGSGQGSLRQQVVYSAASGTVSMVRNACAGGLNSSGSSSDARQGRPTPVAAITGTANFVYQGKDPVKVYVDGALAADFTKGEGSKKVKLEVGYHDVEVRGAGFEVLQRGKLKIEQDFTVDLAFGPDKPVEATNRSWLWSAR